MGRLIKYLLYLVVLAAIAFAGYAMFADLPAPKREMTLEAPDASDR